jgi:hypothetical protein
LTFLPVERYFLDVDSRESDVLYHLIGIHHRRLSLSSGGIPAYLQLADTTPPFTPRANIIICGVYGYPGIWGNKGGIFH